jgi:hypothetical protein
VITGPRTFSAAQHTCAVIEANTHAVFVGEPTGSRPNFAGERTPFRLPCSGLRVNVSDTYWQNGWPQDRRTSIAPELRVFPTIAAYRAKRDLARGGARLWRRRVRVRRPLTGSEAVRRQSGAPPGSVQTGGLDLYDTWPAMARAVWGATPYSAVFVGPDGHVAWRRDRAVNPSSCSSSGDPGRAEGLMPSRLPGCCSARPWG